MQLGGKRHLLMQQELDQRQITSDLANLDNIIEKWQLQVRLSDGEMASSPVSSSCSYHQETSIQRPD